MSNHEHDEHHIVPLHVNIKVFISLVVLTIITVWTAKTMHFGIFNLAVAMLIASTKVFIVMAWFMHLKYEGYTHKLMMGITIAFLLLFVTIPAIDIFSRYNP